MNPALSNNALSTSVVIYLPCSRILTNKWLKFVLVFMFDNGYNKKKQKMAAVEDMLECPSLPKRFPLDNRTTYCILLLYQNLVS
jgi:hypothetical protein